MRENYHPFSRTITLRLTPQEFLESEQNRTSLTAERGKHKVRLSCSTRLPEVAQGIRYITDYVEAEISGTGRNNYDIRVLKEGKNELRTRGILSTRLNGHCLVIKVTQED
jgi:hypothetical protein